MGIGCFDNRQRGRRESMKDNKSDNNDSKGIDKSEDIINKRKNKKSANTSRVNKSKDDINNNSKVKKKNQSNNCPNTARNKIPHKTKKSYSDFNINSNYYLKCPECKNRSPYIEDIEYNSNDNDFKVTYNCVCNEINKKFKKSNLISLLSPDEPLNFCPKHNENTLNFFCQDCKKSLCELCKDEHKRHKIGNNCLLSDENSKKLINIINEKKEEFKGSQIIKNLIEKYLKKKEKDFKVNVNLQINSINNNINIINNNYSNNSNLNDNNSYKKEINSLNSLEDYNKYKDDVSIDKPLPLNNNNNNIIESENEQRRKQYYLKKSLNGHKDKIVSLIQLKSGYIVSGSYDSTILIWDLEKEKSIREIKEIGYVFCLLEFEPNMLLSGTSENNIGLWDLNQESNKYIFNFLGHEYWVNCLVKCTDKIFASASNDCTIRIWDYYQRKEIRAIEAHEDCILTLIILKNGNLCSGSADLLIKFWDWRKGTLINEIKAHDNWIKCLCQLEDETLLSGSDDKTIKVWKNNNCLKELKQHENSVRALTQIDKNFFASGSFDNTIKIWDIKNYECCQTLSGHTSNIICLIKLKNNNFASCSCDCSIKIWEKN